MPELKKPLPIKKKRKTQPKGKDGKFCRSKAQLKRIRKGLEVPKQSGSSAGAYTHHLADVAPDVPKKTVAEYAKLLAKEPETKPVAVVALLKVQQLLNRQKTYGEIFEAMPDAGKYLVALVRGRYQDGTAIVDAPHAVRLQAAKAVLEYGGMGQQEQHDARELEDLSYSDLVAEHKAVQAELGERDRSDPAVIQGESTEAVQQETEAS